MSSSSSSIVTGAMVVGGGSGSGSGSDERIVVDLGALVVRVGFSREAAPRHIVAHSASSSSSHRDIQWKTMEMRPLYDEDTFARFDASQPPARLLRQRVHSLFYDIFFKYLLSDPRFKKVVLCDHLLWPLALKQLLVDVLFEDFQVPSVVFVASELVGLLSVGRDSGLVLDMGYLETVCVPIFAGRPTLRAVQTQPLGGSELAKHLWELLRKESMLVESGSDGTEVVSKFEESSLAETVIRNLVEDIKARFCLVLPRNPESELRRHPNMNEVLQMKIPNHPGKSLRFPRRLPIVACDLLFAPNDEDQTLATIVLESLLKCNYDLRKPLAERMFLTGGLSMIPGLEERLLEEIAHLVALPKSPYSKLAPLAAHFKTVRSSFPASSAAWVGASLLGSCRIPAEQELTLESFVAAKTNLSAIPDWSHSPLMARSDWRYSVTLPAAPPAGEELGSLRKRYTALR